ncbi:MAG: flagellar motor switch protein FliG [Spirochaetota bacterium]|nr:flagellar motor switch protein FliG [Spirochaetota bacterium]
MKSIEEMTGLEKVAALMVILGADAASRVMKYLDYDILNKITVEIAKIGEITIEEKEEMIGEFMVEFRKNHKAVYGGENIARDFIVSAFGEEKADEIFSKLTKKDLEKGFDFVNNIDSGHLASLLENESPQTIAVTLSHLPSRKAADILNILPAYTGKEISKRMARMGKTSPEAVLEIARTLKVKSEKQIELNDNYKAPDGIDTLVNILGSMSLDQEKRLIDYFDITSPDIAEKIRASIFNFEQIVNLTHQEIQVVIDELNDDYQIAIALKGAGDEIKFKFFRNMSLNRATDILNEMNEIGPRRISEINEAREKIVRVMRELSDNGLINLRKDEEKYV